MALIQFLVGGIMWLIFLGWIAHIWSCLDAALWKPRR
jgi:hypothetical protein